MATIIPALIGAAAAVAPTIFGIVDDQQRRKKEEKEKTKAAVEQVRVDHYQNAGIPVSQVPSLPENNQSNKWPEWALPVAVTGGVILFGTLAILAFAGTGKKKKKKSSGKKAKVEDEGDDEDTEEEYDEEE